ncbi:hypothetical protein AB0K04_26200 [Micromonospora coxensis]
MSSHRAAVPTRRTAGPPPIDEEPAMTGADVDLLVDVVRELTAKVVAEPG